MVKFRVALLCVASVCLTACGGGTPHNSVINPPPATFSVGGAVSGLMGTGLVLQNNGADNLPVSSNGGFTFSSSAVDGSSYLVTVLTQPSTPIQNCTVTNGSGTVTANVTTVEIACGNVITRGWTWMGGSNLAYQPATYGTLGLPAPANVPGSRLAASAWPDSTGSLWLFGGFGFDSTLSVSALNDLWKYGSGEWTWIGGSDLGGQDGVYGTQGTPSSNNIPGARRGAFRWTDRAGNFWLFGGLNPALPSQFSDLWKYSAGEWTWVSGPDVPNQPTVYGTQGTADPTNIPGARVSGASWIDPSGDLWLFGGDGNTSVDFGLLNDLWKYDAGEWTWNNGADTVGQLGTYGTLGTPSPGNVPGARRLPASWTDASGALWLFGGNGYDSARGGVELNDLWKFSGGQWTWMGGSNVGNQSGSYGTQGIPAPGNIPGARDSATTWTDASGNFWLFGGQGYDSTGANSELNDLWVYSSGQWTWINGSNVVSQAGTYGTLGTAGPNSPGARDTATGWTDSAGSFWLFGGVGIDSAGATGLLNDLWKYQP